jgi:hypothetical protein
MDLENDPAIVQRRRFMAQRTRKGSSNRKPPVKLATDAAPAVDSTSSVAGAACDLDSASPDIDAGLHAESPSRDIGSDALTTGMDTASSSSAPSDLWIALRRAALHRSFDNENSSGSASSGAPGASSSDVATDIASAPITGMDTASSDSMDVVRSEFDISAAGDLFWSNAADYLALNQRLLDATQHIFGRQRDLVLEISASMLEAMYKAPDPATMTKRLIGGHSSRAVSDRTPPKPPHVSEVGNAPEQAAEAAE